MARNQRRREENPYSTNLERLSVYPSYRNIRGVGNRMEAPVLREGATVRLRVTGIDDEGRPTGFYKGYEISIETMGVELEPGDQVIVELKKISGRRGYGELRGKGK